jgi:hypothetical protein
MHLLQISIKWDTTLGHNGDHYMVYVKTYHSNKWEVHNDSAKKIAMRNPIEII